MHSYRASCASYRDSLLRGLRSGDTWVRSADRRDLLQQVVVLCHLATCASDAEAISTLAELGLRPDRVGRASRQLSALLEAGIAESRPMLAALTSA